MAEEKAKTSRELLEEINNRLCEVEMRQGLAAADMSEFLREIRPLIDRAKKWTDNNPAARLREAMNRGKSRPVS